MKTFTGIVARSALALCLLFAATAIAQTRGTPWTGDAGIRRTTVELQKAQRADEASPASAKTARVLPFRTIDNISKKDKPGALDMPAVATTPGVERSAFGLNAAQTLSTNFTGATLADTNAFPPDSMGAVGPTQFIVAVNGRIRSFDKSGTADGVLNVTTDVFFSSVMTAPLATNFSTDPRIRYDRLTGRWFITMIDVPGGTGALPNRIMIAVSDTASITGSTVWTYFQFQQDLVAPIGDTGFLADYPTLGIDVNALYIGVNMFNAAGSFQNSTAFVVRKSSVLGAGPIVVTAFRNLITLSVTFDGPLTPQGVDNFDPAATEGYFIGVDYGFFSLLQMRRITDPAGTPTISANIPIAVAATRYPANVPHLGNTGGTNGLLDGLDDRLFMAQVRNGQLWTAHNISTNASGGNPNIVTRRNALRWYQFGNLTGAPTITQSGTVFDSTNGNGGNANWYWLPSINVNGQGHAAMGFSAAGITHADAAFTGRLATDTLGTMPGPLTRITNSPFAYNPVGGGSNPRRWGDFSYTSVDPLDDMSMWTIQEFTDATDSYGVRVAKLNAPPPAAPTTPAPTAVAAGQASVIVTLTGTSAAGSGFFDPGPNLPAPALPFTHISASVSGGVTVNSITYVSPTSVTLDLSTVGASAGTKSITITNPDGQSATGTNILTVTKIDQTITFNPLPGKTFGDPPFGVSATGGGSSNPVTFAAAPPSVCTISGNTVTITGVGTCTITADQAGDASYNPAPSVPQSFVVGQAPQAIGFGVLADKVYGDPPFGVSATGGASGNPVTFSSLTGGVCTVAGSTVTIVTVGTCTIAADQAGNVNYAAAPQVQQSFNITQATQTINFGALANKAYGDPPFGVSATGGASGNPVTFSSLTGSVCTVAGATVTIVTVGTCTIAANQAGNANYSAAAQVPQSFNIAQTAQTINFGALADKVFGDPPFSISATGGASGNPVTFSSLTGPVCTVTGSTVTIVTIGTCTIAADQAGNANYSAAPQVQQSFAITAGPAASITVSGGGTQSAAINTNYAAALAVTVRDAGNNPLSNASVTFTLPATGASATFPGALTSVIVPTDVNGVATSPTVTANGTVGAFIATASVTGVATPASFNLLNTSGAAFTIVVTPTTPDWAFVTETAPGSAAGTFVTGPGTPPAGTGSVQLEALIAEGGELFATPQFAGMRLDSLKGLQFSTFVGAGVNDLALDLDVDADLSAPTAVYQGRLVFDPNLLGTVVQGVWQAWDAYTQKAWYASRAPINALCTPAAPCTLQQIITAYPNVGVIQQLFPGAFGFKLGNNHVTGIAAVDKLVLVREGPPATLTAWTFDFEPAAPAAATVTTIAGTPQSTTISTAFTSPLTAEVRDATSQLLSGVSVTFDLPAAGTSGTFPGSVITANAVTTSLGQATSPIATANGVAGSYAATASAGAATPASFALTNSQATTTTSVGSSLNPSTFGATVTFTATVIPAAASGTVSFFDGAVLLGSGTLAGGTATLASSTLATGSHPITAVYAGDANYVGSTSPILTQGVNQASTTTSVVGAPNPSTFGQAVTFTATVVPAAATGTVTFSDGVTVLGTGPVVGGVAIFTTITPLSTGSHVITAAYGGDANYTSSSGTVTQVVNQATTTTNAVGAPNPSNFGQPVTFTATVVPAAATGTVTFSDGVTVLGTGPVVGGIALFTTVAPLTSGSHVITAAYGGDTNYAPSSGTFTQLVNQVPASISATGGTPQSTTVSTIFGSALVATVKDAGNFGVPGVVVTFTLPASGASGTFPGAALSANATTDAAGVATSPLVTANATAGSYSATASAVGVPVPATFSLRNLGLTPVLQGAASRKVHGAAGPFDLPLPLTPLNPATEPRQGPAQTVVFAFDKPITSATVTVAAGVATAGAPTFSGNEVIVALTGVTNAQYVTVTLSNVVAADGGSGGTGSVRAGFLLGDVNGNRVVTVSDLGVVNAQQANVANATNFLSDINANGVITVADRSLTNAALTTALPPP